MFRVVKGFIRKVRSQDGIWAEILLAGCMTLLAYGGYTVVKDPTNNIFTQIAGYLGGVK